MKDGYSKENLYEIVKESHSLSECLVKIGLSPKGSNSLTLKKYIELYSLDTSHFTGQGWNKGLQNTDKAAIVKLNDILKENTNFKSYNLKNRLIAEGIKENKCEKCGLGDEWCGEKIVLELHHINGNHYDNRIDNLQILCPNCHSQTDGFRKRNTSENKKVETFNKTRKVIKICPICNKEFYPDRKTRVYCSRECYNKMLSCEKKK